MRPNFILYGPVVSQKLRRATVERYDREELWKQDRSYPWLDVREKSDKWRKVFKRAFRMAAREMQIDVELSTTYLVALRYPRGVTREWHDDCYDGDQYPKLSAVLALSGGCWLMFQGVHRESVYIPVGHMVVFASRLSHSVPKTRQQVEKMTAFCLGAPYR